MSRTLLAAGLAFAAACSSATGMGDAARKDVAARMHSIQPGVATCYEQALKSNRELRGAMLVGFEIEPETGKFVNVRILQSDFTEATLQSCVTGYVANLKLDKPTSTRQSIEYPLEFAPID